MRPGSAIIRGTNDKPVASKELADFFEASPELDGQLFLGYPIIGTPDGRYSIDAIWLSPEKGIVVFDLIEGTDPAGYDLRQDDAANKLESRLRTHRDLVLRRNLLISISMISFAPGVQSSERHAVHGYRIASDAASLAREIQEINWLNPDQRVYEMTLSAVQSISTIRSGKAKRITENETSRGSRLKSLEGSIAILDSLQGKAVIETVQGVQRIRGLAGSGKTIVLALKAAYLHAQHPDWSIAVTFNTRSLKGQFRRLINNFSVEQAGEEPDWDRLRIINAWGAPGGAERDGIYYQFCKARNIQYFDFRTAKTEFGSGREFAGICEKALTESTEQKPLYDAILIDEAQDFPPSFLRLCYESLTSPKRLVYAYDELQNLSSESLPPPEEIFGKNADNTPRVRFESGSAQGGNQDIILSKCYRNSRPILVTAHSLGFGVYRDPQEGVALGLFRCSTILSCGRRSDIGSWRENFVRAQGSRFAGRRRQALHSLRATHPSKTLSNSSVSIAKMSRRSGSRNRLGETSKRKS